MTGTSPETKNIKFFGNEERLIEGFRELPEEDQEELMEILEMKLRKVKKEKDMTAKSSGLTGTEKGNMVG